MDKAFRNLMAKRLDANKAWDEVRNWKTYTTNDRAGVLVLSAILEQVLEAALKSHFVTDDSASLFDWNGDKVLSTVSAKISLGYHLGIYPQWVRDDLRVINDIRNVFAHSPEPLHFEHEVIRNECSKLSASQTKSYHDDYLQELVGQENMQRWQHRFKNAFIQMPDGPTPEQHKEHMDEVMAGAPHSQNDRDRFWVNCIVLFSYFAYEFAEKKPLRYRESTFFQHRINAAAPPLLPTKKS